MAAVTSALPNHHGFRPDIEGLRGIAILLVVAYHVGIPGITGGYVGVDVFFVLSGYLITSLLTHEAISRGRIDLVEFYARRGRRLLPAAVLVCVATMVAGWFILSPTEIRDLTRSVTAASTYVSNALFAYKATNYLADDARGDAVMHTWSLAVEEQFYLFWPLLVAMVLRVRPGAPDVSTQSRKSRLLWVMALLSAASFALCLVLTNFAQAWAFFGAPARIWEFGAGALATLGGEHIMRRYRRLGSYLPGAGMLALAIAATAYDTGTHFPGVAALLPVLGTVMLLVSGVTSRGQWTIRFLQTGALQVVGRLSYSWYLWHWPVLTFAWILRPEMGLVGRLLCAGSALLLSALTYYTIETPIRYMPVFVKNPRRSVIAALTLTAASVLCAQVVRFQANRAAAAPSQIAFTRAHGDFTRLTKLGCTLSYWGVTPSAGCEFGVVSSDTTVALFGDSHADHWFPAVEQIAMERRWKVLTFSKSECPSITVSLVSQKLGRAYTECGQWRSQAIDRIIAQKPALVVLSNSSAYVPQHGTTATDWQVSAGSWERGTHATAAAFSRAGIHTLVLEDVLRPNFNVPVCLARRAWSSLWQGSQCTFLRDQAANRDVARAEERGVRGLPHTMFANVNPKICNTALCQTRRADTVFYRDSHHLTGEFSKSLAPWLLRQINQALTD